MINQVKIRLAVSQLVSASDFNYEKYGSDECYSFNYLGSSVSIVHLDNDEWYIHHGEDIKMDSIESVIKWILKLEEY